MCNKHRKENEQGEEWNRKKSNFPLKLVLGVDLIFTLLNMLASAAVRDRFS